MVAAVDQFWNWLENHPGSRVLEIGTRRWEEHRPGGHRDRVMLACPTAQYVGTDAMAGQDVDVVADAMRLSDVFPAESFDAVLCVSTLEHIAWPWVAVREIASVLRRDGVCLVTTHQSFPLHHYPSDYFRFSTDALRALFCLGMGWEIVSADYSFAAKVVPIENGLDRWCFVAPAWLHVHLFGVRSHLVDLSRFSWPME